MIATLKSWLRPSNFAWTKWEMVLARLVIAGLLFYFACLMNLKPFETSPEKLNGIAKFVPLMWMLEPSALLVIRIVATIGLVLFVIGWMPVLTFLPGLITMLGMGALRNSKGDIGHSTQVLAMGALAIWICYLYAALRRKEWFRVSLATQRAALFGVVLMVSGSYVASGIVKMKASGGHWIARIPSMSVQMIKANLSDYYSDPQDAVSTTMTETAPKFFIDHPVIAKVVFGTGLILELGAFVMVLGRRWALLWGGSLLLMHAGISLLMDIEFWNHMSLLAVTCVIPGLLGVWRDCRSGVSSTS
jgi:hypothetical protein